MENIGIGIDIVDVNQFTKMPVKTKSKFYKKIFSPAEIKYCLKYKNPYEHFAGKFAIKEAVKKSIADKISMSDIETHHIKLKPHVRLRNSKKKYSFYVSVSHEKNLAVAVVISKIDNKNKYSKKPSIM